MSTSEKPKAVIVYMARSTDLDIQNLTRSLKLLDKHFNDRFGYPVMIFHEDFSDTLKAQLCGVTKSELLFELLAFAIPEFLNPADVPEKVLGRFGVGYRHMCRFFGGMMYRHPAMQRYDWYWRLDTDSFLLSPIKYDVFRYMASRDLWYGYMVMLEETPAVVEGLWDATQEYLKDKGLTPAKIDHLLTPAGQWNYLYYYNNFEICSLTFGRSTAYSAYFDYLDRLGGIYKHRWGDAPIRTLAVALLVPPEKIHRFTDVPYAHAGYYSHRRQEIQDRLIRFVKRKLGQVK